MQSESSVSLIISTEQTYDDETKLISFNTPFLQREMWDEKFLAARREICEFR